jgi:probable F420-dependent oxidoreductase
MKYNFQYPETIGTELDMLRAGPMGQVAALAERWGFGALSLSDHPVPGRRWLEAGGHQTLDPFVGLAFAAEATSRLRVLTNLAVGPYRQPMLTAKAAATLDKLSDGRLILGIGVGYLKGEYHALGVDHGERNRLVDELLDVLPLHWSGEPFSYQGGDFDARDVIALPAPVQRPIPIWIGGNSPLSRRRALRAQGWMPMIGGVELATTTRTTMIETFADAARLVRQVTSAAADEGRVEPLDVMLPYWVEGLVEEPDRHREAIAGLEAAGVTWLTISPPPADDLAATAEFIEAFGTLYLEPSVDPEPDA